MNFSASPNTSVPPGDAPPNPAHFPVAAISSGGTGGNDAVAKNCAHGSGDEMVERVDIDGNIVEEEPDDGSMEDGGIQWDPPPSTNVPVGGGPAADDTKSHCASEATAGLLFFEDIVEQVDAGTIPGRRRESAGFQNVSPARNMAPPKRIPGGLSSSECWSVPLQRTRAGRLRRREELVTVRR